MANETPLGPGEIPRYDPDEPMRHSMVSILVGVPSGEPLGTLVALTRADVGAMIEGKMVKHPMGEADSPLGHNVYVVMTETLGDLSSAIDFISDGREPAFGEYHARDGSVTRIERKDVDG